MGANPIYANEDGRVTPGVPGASACLCCASTPDVGGAGLGLGCDSGRERQVVAKRSEIMKVRMHTAYKEGGECKGAGTQKSVAANPLFIWLD